MNLRTLISSCVVLITIPIAAQDLGRSSFVALTGPCRILDTRIARDGKLASGVTRAFVVKGTDGFGDQGGTDGGCGLPRDAAAAMINFVAVQPEGAGNLKGNSYPNDVPVTGNIINYQALTPALNVANAITFPLCAEGECEFDIVVQPNGAGVHLVADVTGYYLRGVVARISAGGGLMMIGGEEDVAISIAPQGVTQSHLGASAVTTGAIQDGAVSGAKIANNQIVRSINNVKDAVTIAGSGVSTAGSTITINSSPAPTGSMLLGAPGDTTIIGAGYAELGESGVGVWRPISQIGAASARTSHSAVWTGSKMLIWGGVDAAGNLLNTGGVYDPATDTWSQMSVPVGLEGRFGHTAIWTGSTMIVWGGVYSDGVTQIPLNSGGVYDTSTNTWTLTSTSSPAPTARYAHTAVWAANVGRMIVWGGTTGTAAMNSGSQYVPASNSWIAVTPLNAPAAREGHTAVGTVDGSDRMIVWGGTSGGSPATYYSDGAIYNPTGPGGVWTTLSAPNPPAARAHHKAVWNGTAMIVWGGGNASPSAWDGAVYRLDSNTWATMSNADAPSERHGGFSATLAGTRVIIFGGYTGVWTPFGTSTGAIYDPDANAWTPILTGVNPPNARGDHTAVWTGTHLVVFGGQLNGYSPPHGDGARWSPLSLYVKN